MNKCHTKLKLINTIRCQLGSTKIALYQIHRLSTIRSSIRIFEFDRFSKYKVNSFSVSFHPLFATSIHIVLLTINISNQISKFSTDNSEKSNITSSQTEIVNVYKGIFSSSLKFLKRFSFSSSVLCTFGLVDKIIYLQ